ncbi:MAG: hypothetical protein ACRDL3_15240, partial [Solirubrobacterales bacterium]
DQHSPQATASASVKKQLKKLKKRVAQLEGQGGPNVPDSLPPSGPAGGDLTGNYPNPQLGLASVGIDELADDSVTSPKIANATVGSDDLGDDSVGLTEIASSGVSTSEIAQGAVTDGELNADSVGASELKGTYAAVSGGTSPAADTYADQTATCNAGDTALGGGYAWQNDAATISTVASTPDPLSNPNQWIVRSKSSAAGNTLFAWAACLAN